VSKSLATMAGADNGGDEGDATKRNVWSTKPPLVINAGVGDSSPPPPKEIPSFVDDENH
jgi:hypothetical protein